MMTCMISLKMPKRKSMSQTIHLINCKSKIKNYKRLKMTWKKKIKTWKR